MPKASTMVALPPETMPVVAMSFSICLPNHKVSGGYMERREEKKAS